MHSCNELHTSPIVSQQDAIWCNLLDFATRSSAVGPLLRFPLPLLPPFPALPDLWRLFHRLQPWMIFHVWMSNYVEYIMSNNFECHHVDLLRILCLPFRFLCLIGLKSSYSTRTCGRPHPCHHGHRRDDFRHSDLDQPGFCATAIQLHAGLEEMSPQTWLIAA